MIRFALFVDGSNMFHSIKTFGFEINDYQAFFYYLYKKAEQTWRSYVCVEQHVATLLQRVYWYDVGSIDNYNLDDKQTQMHLRDLFQKNNRCKTEYLEKARKNLQGQNHKDILENAWSLCFNELRNWYDQKSAALDSMKRFHYGVQKSTHLIDIIEAGNWTVDFNTRSCTEKGLDTKLAVDMIALENNYDVAVVVSGDADSIPSISLMKSRGKHVCAIEFIRGGSNGQGCNGFSSKIKIAADFIVQIHELDLVSKGVAKKVEVKCLASQNDTSDTDLNSLS